MFTAAFSLGGEYTDNRLLLCASLVEGRKVCDIGTDHGYLPCYLVSNGKCDSALACDIGEKPLSQAREHIKAQGLEDRIKTVLSDGLDSVELEGVTDIVLAGMGGELIADILSRCERIKYGSVNIIMQPMTKSEFLRQWLYDNGFAVTDEQACISGRFAYSVMSGRFNRKPEYVCDEDHLHFGLVSDKTAEGREYILRRCESLERAAKGMTGSQDKKASGERLLEIVYNKRKEVGENGKGQ